MKHQFPTEKPSHYLNWELVNHFKQVVTRFANCPDKYQKKWADRMDLVHREIIKRLERSAPSPTPWRTMRVGEIKSHGDQSKGADGRWSGISGTIGLMVKERERGMFRTKKPLPAFYRKK